MRRGLCALARAKARRWRWRHEIEKTADKSHDAVRTEGKTEVNVMRTIKIRNAIRIPSSGPSTASKVSPRQSCGAKVENRALREAWEWKLRDGPPRASLVVPALARGARVRTRYYVSNATVLRLRASDRPETIVRPHFQRTENQGYSHGSATRKTRLDSDFQLLCGAKGCQGTVCSTVCRPQESAAESLNIQDFMRRTFFCLDNCSNLVISLLSIACSILGDIANNSSEIEIDP
jgi:hypothetical protein